MTTNLNQAQSELAQCRREVEATQQLFKNIIEKNADGIVIVDQEGYVRFANPAAEALFGRSAKELKGTIFGFPVIAGETAELDLLRPDRTQAVVEMRVVATEWEHQPAYLASLRDVTTRKHTEEALTWESKVNAILAKLSKAMISQSSFEEISYMVLEEAKKLTRSHFGYVGYIHQQTGYLICPTMTRDIWDECQVPDKSIVFKEFGGLWGWVLNNRESMIVNDLDKDARSTSTPVGHIPITRFLSAPAMLGDELVGQIALANSSRLYTQRDLNFVSRLASLYALTIQRQRAKMALRASEQRYRLLFDSLQDGFALHEIICDENDQPIDYRFLEVNPAYEVITGLKREEIIGKRVREVWPEVKAGWIQKFGKVALFGEYHRFEDTIPTDQSEHNVEIAAYCPARGKFATLITDITQRKQAEEVRARMAAIVESSSDAIIGKTLDGIITSWNTGAEQIYGYTAEEVIGEHICIISPPDCHDEIADILTKIQQGQRVHNLETERVRRDGQIIPVALSVSPIRNAKGKIIGASTIARDIRQRKAAEQALREAEQRLDTMLQTMVDGIIRVDEYNNITYANRSAEQILELKRDDATGHYEFKHPWRYVDNEGMPYPPNQSPLMIALRKGEEKTQEEIGIVGPGGEEKWLSVSAAPLRDHTRKIYGAVASFRNISERKQMNAQLRKLSRAIEQSPSSVVITDINGDIEYVNPRFTQLTGYSKEEAMGQNPRILKSGHHTPEFYDELWDMISDGQEWRDEFCNQRKDGSIYWESASISPIRNENGVITHYVKVAEDITERKAMEAKLHDYTHHLEQLVDEKVQELELERAKVIQTAKLAALGEMATGIAHELNQPLTAMLFDADYLKMLSDNAREGKHPVDPDELYQMGEDLESDIERSRRIIDHLRAFARTSPRGASTVDLNQTIKESFILVGERLKLHNVDVTLDLHPEPLLMLGKPNRLEQVLLNLISNAEYAMTEMESRVNEGLVKIEPEDFRKELHITTYRNGDTVVAEITDNGSGIPAEKHEHIFTPFFTTKPVGEGTGLGLSISYGIVKDFDGEITFESEENQGTTFILRFPALDEK
ncbi:MAG: PAS domain S-box protein [Chloroflexi bacterium]|jgi:PAS domain S-box-containing protein|nr:PAS domain S-box protein [Chloroflexota bacterium]